MSTPTNAQKNMKNDHRPAYSFPVNGEYKSLMTAVALRQTNERLAKIGEVEKRAAQGEDHGDLKHEYMVLRGTMHAGELARARQFLQDASDRGEKFPVESFIARQTSQSVAWAARTHPAPAAQQQPDSQQSQPIPLKAQQISTQIARRK
ncbi:hypothetical protein [Streptomyces sp. NPDC058394]|uniref:hypothetical protein n=1 Tax=Streptomyces sp. NPDC058394 TaxID=3346477 RepID=UPI00365C20DA